MLRKFALALALCAPVAFVGCGATEVSDTVESAADAAKDGVDAAADKAKGAAGDMAPEGMKDTVEGGVDAAADKAKDGIDAAAGTGSDAK